MRKKLNNWSYCSDPNSGHSLLICADNDFGWCSVEINAATPTDYALLPETLPYRLDSIWYESIRYDSPPGKKWATIRIMDYCAMELLRRYINAVKNDIFLISVPSVHELIKNGEVGGYSYVRNPSTR